VPKIGRAVRNLIAISLGALLVGCQTMVPPEPEVRTARPIAKIDICSSPPGCVVELNNEYLGVTPLELVVEANTHGTWTGTVFDAPYFMRCSMPDGNGWEQKVWRPGDRIPSRILFRIPGYRPEPLAFN